MPLIKGFHLEQDNGKAKAHPNRYKRGWLKVEWPLFSVKEQTCQKLF